MFDQIVLITAVMLGITFVRLARRLETGQRGYMLVVAAVLALSVAALARGSRFLGVVVVALGAIIVVVPWLLETLARLAFTRGRLSLAVRLAGLRALLMPGAGLGRQQEILQGLALLERDGVDKALDHFRGLADDTEDNGELALINEQIVSMLFYGQRWDEGIAHYEARFHPRYAAMRPALALGLLRAYGESGKLETAAGLLRALEEGPAGTDPRALGMLSQARLTFLAYAGAATPVVSALTQERRRLLGLSEASGALFRGIALARAGQPQQARAELQRVEQLAKTADARVLDASRHAMARLSDADAVALEPEMRRYVDTVADRLETFLSIAPRMRRPGSLLATPLLLMALVAGYAAVLALGDGGIGLLTAGALTPELWNAGSWGRAVLGVFVQVDPMATLLNVYAVWLAAPLVERVYGTGRLVLVALGGAIAGLVAAAAVEPNPAAVLAGGNLLATAVTAAAAWTLLPARTPALPRRTRQGLAIPLVLVLVAEGASVHPGLFALDTSPIGLLVAAAVAIAAVGLVSVSGRVAQMVRWLALPLVLAVPVAAWKVARENVEAFNLAHRSRTTVTGGVSLQVSEMFMLRQGGEEIGTSVPVLEGVVDTVALRAGVLVDFVVSERAPDADTNEPAVFGNDPSLRHAIDPLREDAPPSSFAEAFAEAGGNAERLRSYRLRMGGQDVARVIEHTVDGRVVSLVASPPDAAEHAPQLYAAILADAENTGPAED